MPRREALWAGGSCGALHVTTGQRLQRDLRCWKDPHRDRHGGAAMPVEASNHLRMLRLKAVVVSVRERGREAPDLLGLKNCETIRLEIA